MFTQSNLGKTVDCIEKYYKCGLYYLETRDNVLMFFRFWKYLERRNQAMSQRFLILSLPSASRLRHVLTKTGKAS